MSRAKVLDVDYFEFRRWLQEATDGGNRIEPRQKEAWAQYVKDHGVREVVMKQWARRFEKGEHVIIDVDDSRGGYYVFSSHDELVYKWATE